MEYWLILLSIVIGAFSIYYLLKNFNFFKRHGVIHVPPLPMFGIVISAIFRRIPFADFLIKIYNFYPDAKYFGIYLINNPTFLVRDPELIKSILVKDFEAFQNRRGFSDLSDPLFAKNLFSLRGEEWRNVRTLLSPSFTSSKMKMMFTLMSECAEEFTKFLLTLPEDKCEIDIKDAFSKYMNDVIATCAFGIKTNSMKDPTNKFYVYGKESSNFLRGRSLKFIFLTSFPSLGRIFNIKLVDDKIMNFFKDIVKTTIATRDAEHITRPDMLQLMMDIRGKEGHRELDIDEMTAQAFLFFFGGFDTSSIVMSFAAHEIAVNPKVQTKLHQEIDKVLEESNGELSYESINRLEYLDAVISEALRLYPAAYFLDRQFIAIHRDKKYYNDPEKFCPDRFLNNRKNQNSSLHASPYYMPFGLGPRMCIANRFALLVLKVLLFYLLARCELKPCAKTTFPMKFAKSLALMPENGFWLNIQRRKDMHPVLNSAVMNG
ncbi:cytochrome P450 9e2-like isoform X2 [Monomorium pharaonis]|uniref:cytochrome P450 9e2-like isoform X2 n=1 Tax=Monomorium pharaonis TaxID=307658 RepID=UPI001746847A|nr:cytochrome P450 9e2-like isoform X2 [Monomorium pharaonis]